MESMNEREKAEVEVEEDVKGAEQGSEKEVDTIDTQAPTEEQTIKQ